MVSSYLYVFQPISVLCVFVYMQKNMYVSACASVCTCMKRSEVTLGGHFLSTVHLVLLKWGSHCPGTQQQNYVGCGPLQSQVLSYFQLWDYSCTLNLLRSF